MILNRVNLHLPFERSRRQDATVLPEAFATFSFRVPEDSGKRPHSAALDRALARDGLAAELFALIRAARAPRQQHQLGSLISGWIAANGSSAPRTVLHAAVELCRALPAAERHESRAVARIMGATAKAASRLLRPEMLDPLGADFVRECADPAALRSLIAHLPGSEGRAVLRAVGFNLYTLDLDPARERAIGRAIVDLCRSGGVQANREIGAIIRRTVFRSLVNVKHDQAQRFLEPIAEFLALHQLPARELIRLTRHTLAGRWIDTAPVSRLGAVLAHHIGVIEQLDLLRPGAAALLYRSCGLRCFGRYEPEALAVQYDAIREARAGTGLRSGCVPLFYPLDDEQGSFYLNRDPVRAVLTAARTEGVPALFFESASAAELLKQLLRIRRLFGPIETAVVGGHGAPGGFLALSPGRDLEAEVLQNPRVRQMIRRILHQACTLVVRSCWGGASYGVARRLAAEFGGDGFEVYGGMNETYLERLELTRRSDRAGILAVTASFGREGADTAHFTGPVDLTEPGSMPDPGDCFQVVRRLR